MIQPLSKHGCKRDYTEDFKNVAINEVNIWSVTSTYVEHSFRKLTSGNPPRILYLQSGVRTLTKTTSSRLEALRVPCIPREGVTVMVAEARAQKI